MPPKKKRKIPRCTKCNLFGHLVDECITGHVDCTSELAVQLPDLPAPPLADQVVGELIELHDLPAPPLADQVAGELIELPDFPAPPLADQVAGELIELPDLPAPPLADQVVGELIDLPDFPAPPLGDQGFDELTQVVDELVHSVDEHLHRVDELVDSVDDPGDLVDEPVQQDEDCSNDIQCACCHRISTTFYPLQFDLLPQNYRKRLYGDASQLGDEPFVCQCCLMYLDTDGPIKADWNHAWPAVLYSCLTRPSLKFNHEKLMHFLPLSIRDSFKCIRAEMIPEVSALWTIKPRFIDSTRTLKHFREQIESHKLANLVTTLDKYPYATCVCPIGCNIYIDLERDCSLLPASNYLDFISSNFNSFNSNSHYFDGIRPDWPFVEVQIAWKTGATLVVDEKEGLCIVTCSADRHSDGRNKFVHVPRNPLLKNSSHLAPDAIAPASVIPNFVRSGRSNQMNSSAVVLKEKGGVSGASSFTLSARPLIDVQKSNDELWSMGFALQNRPDVHQSLVDAHVLELSHYSDLLKGYERSEQKLPENVVQAAKQSGTYVNSSDSVHLLKNYQERHLEFGDNQNEASTSEMRKKGNEVLEIIHPVDDLGALPYSLPYLSKKGQPQHSGIVLHAVIHTLLHSRFLHNLFLEQMKIVVDNSLHNELQHIIKLVSQNKTPTKALQLETKLIASLEVTRENPQPTVLAVAILKKLCNVKSLTIKRNLRSLEAAVASAEKVCLVDVSSIRSSNEEVPLTLCNGQWQLSYASRYQFDAKSCYTFEEDFRWTADFKWHHCTGNKDNTSSNLLRPLDWNYLVYVEPKSMTAMTKEQYINWSGGQTKLKCSRHDKKFMMKEGVGSGLKCSYVGCPTQIRWRCSHGFGSLILGQCRNGVCLKHAAEILKDNSESGIITPQTETCARERAVSGTDVELTSEIPETENEELTTGDALEQLLDPPDYVCSDVENVADDYCLDTGLSTPNLPSSTQFGENSFVSNNPGMSGHFLLNHHLCCFSRANINRKSPVSFQRFFQHLHSIGSDQSLPLVYPEALLFPQIFWAMIETSLIGAMPSVLFTEYGKSATFGGFASLVDHLRVRLSDNNSLTSRDPSYIAFAFDVYLNCLLQSNSISVALKKGLEHINRAFVQTEDRQSNFRFDEVDSRTQVNRLSALMRDHPWTYFITLTCNDSTTFGVGPIRQALERIHRNKSRELDRALQNNATILCKAWERAVYYFFNYVMASKEEIFGKVRSYWYRFEFQSQGALGNRPHVHGGLTIHPDHLDDVADLDRIANRITDVFSQKHRTDFKSLLADKIVKDFKEFLELYDLGDRLTRHSCDNSSMRCQKLRADGTYKCRVPRHEAHGPAYFKESISRFDEDCQKRLLKLGLAHKRYNLEGIRYSEVRNDVIPVKELRGGRWIYPTDPECIRVPTNGRLFVAFKSMCNVQRCDLRFQSAYLANYAAGADEKREVVITAANKNATELNVEARDLHHSKIAGASIAAKAQQKRDNAPEALAREIALTEMIWFTSSLPYIRSNIQFQNFSTHAPEHRCAIIRKKSAQISKLLNEDGTLTPVCCREGFPAWRQFTASQILLIKEVSQSRYLIDSTSSFSLRPPELHCISFVADYLQWFSSSSASKYQASIDIDECPWIDGGGRQMKIRLPYVKAVRDHVRDLARRVPIPAHLEMLPLFESLSEELEEEEKSSTFKRYVDTSSLKEVVVVPTAIEPKQFNKFLVHLLLTQGTFVTELDLFGFPTLLHSFEKAQLIRDANNPTEMEANLIIKRYVMMNLRVLPLSAGAFARCLSVAMDGLHSFFKSRQIEYAEMPLASLRAIQLKANDELLLLEKHRRESLATVLCNQGIPNVPDVGTVASGKEFRFDPLLGNLTNQSRFSRAEQSQTLRALTAAIDAFINAGISSSVRFPLISGPPGAGKTYLLMIAALYAMSKGLKVIATAMLAERAQVLGGQHIHLLFGIPVSKSQLETVSALAERCLLGLVRSPTKMAQLKRVDVLVIEEIGLVPGYLFNVLDAVMRRIKDTCLPFGGVLLLCSGDPKQLKPVQGRPIWLSPNVYTMFHILCLKHFVRSRSDEDLQKIITKIRKPTLEADDITEVVSVLKRRCAPQNFVPSWKDIPDQYHRVVGKNVAVDHAINVYINQKKATPGLLTFTQRANDETDIIGGNWQPASTSVSKQLSKNVKEPFELLLYVGQSLRLTYNNTSASRTVPRFSQGQLVVVVELPNPAQSSELQRVTVKLLPPGCRDVDTQNIPAEWPCFKVARRFTIPTLIGCNLTKARRQQYPFAYYVCSTVHRILGDTCSKLATQISSENEMFSLWDRDQLLVIISRVCSLNDLVFVGSVSDTMKAIRELLAKTDPWDKYIDKVMTACDTLRDGDGLLPYANTLPTLSTFVPSTNCGFVYMLVSMKYTEKYKLGETQCLEKVLKAYNCSHFSELSHLRPWALACFVCGFPKSGSDIENEEMRRSFLISWAETVYTDHGNNATSKVVLRCGKRLFGNFVEKQRNADVQRNTPNRSAALVFKQCCVLESTTAPPSI